ncbi:MAG TPA: ATP-binding cassette domain-containing protein [Acidobacteriaceae bacterium]
MPELEKATASAQSSVAQQGATPWLEFAVHHRSNETGGLTLAAEAALRRSLAVLVGPSGAGKTSLLRSIAGLLKPDRGQIRVLGKTVWDSADGMWIRPRDRHCGLVTQRPALFPALTVAENIAFGLHDLPREERKRRVEEMAALFRLDALLDRRPPRLSGGEQQRAAVARTLAPRPRVLLLDEPFAGLNLELKDTILTDLEHWLKVSETPVMYVTHDVAEAWRMGSGQRAEVLRIEAGRIVQQGAAAEVLAEDRARLLLSLG